MPTLTNHSEDAPLVLASKVRRAISQMSSGKAVGNNGITTEILKAGSQELWESLAKRFSRYLEMLKISDSWKESITVLLYKKEYRGNLKNYRPMWLLSNIYKLFTKVITNRLTRTLDEQ